MTSPADLLPDPFSPFERALGTAMGDELPVPIAQIVDPTQTPIAFLPWLAVHDGVRLWFSDWTEQRKRLVVSQSLVANFEVGTRAAGVRFVGYVDGAVLDVVAYPARFVLGRARLGRTPIGHGPWVARHLVRVVTQTPRNAFVMGRARVGRAAGRTPSREPFDRVCAALRAAKGPETEYRVDFATSRQITIADAIPLDGSHALGEYVDRVRF